MANEGFHNASLNGTQGGGFNRMPQAQGFPHQPQQPQHEGTARPAAPVSGPAPTAGAQEEPKPGKPRKSRSGRAKAPSKAKQVTPETVGAILEAADKVSKLEGKDATLLKDLLGLPENTAENKLIAVFLSRKERTKALKKVDGELEITNSIKHAQQSGAVDFDTVFTILGLGHENRLERWNMASGFDNEAAKAVAGTDDGKWPRSWSKSDQDESKGLYSLYVKILEPYSEKMEWFKRVLA